MWPMVDGVPAIAWIGLGNFTSAVPPDLAKRLAKDRDPLVASKAREVIDALRALPEDAYEKRFGPFGI
jgi:hypothetical protein